MFFPLSERMVEKMIKEKKLDAEAELILYLMILNYLGKHDKAVEVLDGDLSSKFVMSLKDTKNFKAPQHPSNSQFGYLWSWYLSSNELLDSCIHFFSLSFWEKLWWEVDIVAHGLSHFVQHLVSLLCTSIWELNMQNLIPFAQSCSFVPFSAVRMMSITLRCVIVWICAILSRTKIVLWMKYVLVAHLLFLARRKKKERKFDSSKYEILINCIQFS